MTSLETEDEPVDTRDQFIEVLAKAGSKYDVGVAVGRLNVLDDTPVEDRVADVNIEESELPCMKALGVQWTLSIQSGDSHKKLRFCLIHCKC